MIRARVIPLLLLLDKGLVKSVRFKDYKYIGDPINAVKIFNDLKADELVFLDILASKQKRPISLDFVRKVGDEANMPFAVGGGIRSISDIKSVIQAGAEKVVINTYAHENPEFIETAAKAFGSSTIVVAMDIKKTRMRKIKKVYMHSTRRFTKYSPAEYAQLMEEKGAGELIVNSIDNDGMMTGYDLDLIHEVSSTVKIPVVAAGGAANTKHFQHAIKNFASAVAAGSMFVFHGKRNAVLINYPSKEILKTINYTGTT
jgi:imidazole glycerol-phosphate synthase subunit HisF